MLTRKQLWVLVALTLMWGVNWPMMKLSLRELSPLYFRALTMTGGALWLFFFFRARGVRMWPRWATGGGEWRSVVWLGLPNILGWHTLSILGVSELASAIGRNELSIRLESGLFTVADLPGKDYSINLTSLRIQT